MAGFDHSAQSHEETESEQSARRRTLLARGLFLVYLALYVGFMLLTTLRPDVMQRTPWRGINLAVLYGLGLIGAAFVLAVLYDVLCRILAARDGGRR